MQENGIIETEITAAPVGGGDLSLISLLLEADIFVKVILVILVIASIWSWAVIFEKSFTLSSLRKKAKSFEDSFWAGRSEDPRSTAKSDDSASRVFEAASREWSDVRHGQISELEAKAMVERAERAMNATVDRELDRANAGLGVLATIGSASPFIGLLGTVWGIMNAFLRIGQLQDTSLGVVAGPIAEALFATALGLVAAIPAVIFYNKFRSEVSRFADQLDTFSQDVLVRLSRQASERASGKT